ncbi:hypothetical protein V6N13_002735 [Hibiscus sabdariffa]
MLQIRFKSEGTGVVRNLSSNASSKELGSKTDIDLDLFPSPVDSTVNNSGMHSKVDCLGYRSVEPAAPLESNTKSELFGCPRSDIPSKKLDSSFKEPDDLYDPTGSLPGREPQFQLLECDSINKNRRSSSSTYQNTNWTVVPALQRSWDHQQSLNIPFSSFKNLDDSHDPVGSSPGRDSHLPLLEWHSVEVNGRSLSATCPNSNWTLIPAVQSSWNHQRNQNNWCESFDCIHYETACQGSETSSSLPSPENHLGFMRNALVEENQTPGFGNQFSLALNLPWKSYNQVV